MKIANEQKPSLEDALAHFGVKGQKWGVRRARNRQLNRASRQRDRATAKRTRAASLSRHNKSIDEARARLKSGQTKTELKTAKATFKTDKQAIGSREARKKLNKARDKAQNDRIVAGQIRNGKEATIAVLAVAGSVIIRAAAASR